MPAFLSALCVGCNNNVLFAVYRCKKEDILSNESQNTETQIYWHPHQIIGSQGPSYSAISRSHSSFVLCRERGTAVSFSIL